MVHEMLTKLGNGKLFSGLSHWLSEQVVKAGRRAGVPVRAHDLRRTFATTWRGSDLSLKYIGGWASWRMVEHYSKRRLDKAQEDHKQFSPITVMNDRDNFGIKDAVNTSDNGRVINLIVNNPVIYQPEPQEWPQIEINGKVETLMPFIALAIIPATDWLAVFAEENGLYKRPLACFALIKHEDGTQDIEGMCVCLEHVLDSVEHHGNFIGYEAPGEETDWTEAWQDWIERNVEKTTEVKPIIHAN